MALFSVQLISALSVRVSHEQRQERARASTAERAAFEREVEEFALKNTDQPLEHGLGQGAETTLSPTRRLSASSLTHSGSTDPEASSPTSSPEVLTVRKWAHSKSLLECLGSISEILPELEGTLPYNEPEVAARAKNPTKQEEAAARKLYMRLMRLLHPERQKDKSEQHAALCSAVFHALTALNSGSANS